MTRVPSSSQKSLSIKNAALDVQRIASGFKMELRGLKDQVAAQINEMQQIQMLEMNVIMSKVLKNRPTSPLMKHFKLDFFEPKSSSREIGNRHLRKPSRRYDEPLEDAPLDTARSHDPL